MEQHCLNKQRRKNVDQQMVSTVENFAIIIIIIIVIMITIIKRTTTTIINASFLFTTNLGQITTTNSLIKYVFIFYLTRQNEASNHERTQLYMKMF